MTEVLAPAGPLPAASGLHGLFNRLQRHRPDGLRLEAFVEDVFHALNEELRLVGLLVYVERREGFELVQRVGEQEAVAASIGHMRPSLERVLQHGVYIFADPQEEVSPWIDGILSCRPSAGVVVGRRPHRRVLFFVLDDGWSREAVDFALNVLRAGLGLQLLEYRVQLNVRQVAELQESLLREGPPALRGFEIAARSIPAEEIGGDFCDFVQVGRDVVGFALGDACGHGLPAALLVRDVVTGLRMGLEKHLRMEYVFAKLNRVIHRSNLSGWYVSVFYGELESNGNLSYVNAGHQPPLLFRGDRVHELRVGGTVIGPLQKVRYRRGIVRLDPGDALVLFTDGIVERRSPDGELFGEERLKGLVQANRGATARELLQRILDAASVFGDARPWEDDVTVMVVRRPDD